MDSNKYYQPSGKFSSGSLAISLLVVLIVSFFVSIIYNWLNNISPFIVLNVFIVIGFWVFVFFASQSLIIWGKVRNIKFGIILGFLLALLITYFQWAAFINLRIGSGVYFDLGGILEWMAYPGSMWQEILNLNDVGTFVVSRRGTSVGPTGFWLWLIWGFEFLITIGVAIFAANATASTPYSETAEEWLEATRLSKNFEPISDSESFIKKMENFDSDFFNKYLESKPNGSTYSFVTIFYSEKAEESYLGIMNVTLKENPDNKKPYESKELVIDDLRIPRELAQKLIRDHS